MPPRPYTLILDIDDSIQYPTVFSWLHARSGSLGVQNAMGQEPWFLELMRAAPLAPWVPRYRAWIRCAAEVWYVSGR
ncbi:MAG: hypothetical protein GYA24_10230 [Candidatus Lokiarchaeota archaeon]|nr:hypothetical protein [Candidatus Lokiarchaeota archaeon]